MCFLVITQEASVFLFDKRTADKLHKPRRKETISEMLRHGVRQLERCRHPRLLHVLHSVEETADTLAFATEPVVISLGNILTATSDNKPLDGDGAATGGSSSEHVGTPTSTTGRDLTSDPKIKGTTELPFLDIEVKYGILQVNLTGQDVSYRWVIPSQTQAAHQSLKRILYIYNA